MTLAFPINVRGVNVAGGRYNKSSIIHLQDTFLFSFLSDSDHPDLSFWDNNIRDNDALILDVLTV